MNIVEKLGITPGPWKFNDIRKTLVSLDSPNEKLDLSDCRYERMQISDATGEVFQSDEEYYPYNSMNEKDWRLQAAAPEMLEALIERAASEEQEFCGVCVEEVAIIEKATGKTWEEIKELVE